MCGYWSSMLGACQKMTKTGCLTSSGIVPEFFNNNGTQYTKFLARMLNPIISGAVRDVLMHYTSIFYEVGNDSLLWVKILN